MTTYYCGHCIKASASPPAACTCGSFEFTTCRDCAWATGDVANQRSAPAPRDVAAAKLYGGGHTYGCLGHCGGKLHPSVNGGYPIIIEGEIVGHEPVDSEALAMLDTLAAWADQIAADVDRHGVPKAKDPFRPEDVQATI